METSSAVLLRRIRLTETSLIVTWLTRDHGKVKTVAKGALRPKSAFAGRLDFFYQCDIQFARSRRSDLHTLREATLRNPFEGIRSNYHRMCMAGYFAELLDLATEPEHPAPELYDLLVRALGYLDTSEPTRRALLYFESELARLLGVLSDAPPVTALAGICGRLPPGREELLGS